MAYAKGTPVWISTKSMVIVKCKYSREIDHGGHGSGYQEDFVLLPDGSEVQADRIFGTEGEAMIYLKDSLNHAIKRAETEMNDAAAKLKNLRKIEAYVNG